VSWLKKGLIYNTKGTHPWSISHAQVPIVDKVNKDTWRIYYSTRDSQNQSNTSFIEVEANHPKNIIYIHNKSIIDKGALGCFDDSGVMPTCIINNGGKKYLYYIGWTTGKTIPYRNGIGLVISDDDGRTFKKYSTGPIIGAGPYDPSFTGTMVIYEINGMYHGYYLSCYKWEVYNGKPEPFYNIKYAKSIDAINWQRDGTIAIPIKKDEGGIASATIIKSNNIYKMWYSVRKGFDYSTNKLNSYKIGYAESIDLINWIRKDNDAGITISQNGWDSKMLAYPNVIESSGKLYMFYNGNGFGESGFGYAILEIDRIT
jgi:hypothetical protein